MTAITKKTKRRILPISIDKPAMPFIPKSILTIARTKKMMEARNMGTPVVTRIVQLRRGYLIKFKIVVVRMCSFLHFLFAHWLILWPKYAKLPDITGP